MDYTTLLFIVIGVFVGIGITLILRKSPSNSKDLDRMQDLLFRLSEQQEDKIEKTRQELDMLLREQNKLLNSQMISSQQSIQSMSRESNEVIKQVTQKLTSIEKTNDQVVGFAKQLDSLQKVLTNPKQRGVLGEYFLETTLKNVLSPKDYQMQYKFKNGEIVDAAVFVKNQVIPVDSKFSLENYNRIIGIEDPVERERLEKDFRNDLKMRIDETSKYIRPEENTTDFAFMFIPSEGIYYDLLVNKVGALQVNTQDLIVYAFKEKRVIIVSPTSFLAYLQTVVQGLRALQIEESAKQIKENISKLAKHLAAYESFFGKVGRNLNVTVNAYNDATKEFKKIDKDMYRISGDTMELTAEEISKVDE